MDRRVVSRFWEFKQGGARVVEDSCDVTSEDVGWLLDCTKSPHTINGVIPDGRL